MAQARNTGGQEVREHETGQHVSDKVEQETGELVYENNKKFRNLG